MSFRKGWESERLADFLLSRVAFVASPTTVADDVGSDFYCTLFEALPNGSTTRLRPRLSTAIQIKSAGKSEFPLCEKIDYLYNLELPYLLGIADRSRGALAIYSGCYLPLVFSKHGKRTPLTAVLSDQLLGVLPKPLDIPLPDAAPFPLITTLEVGDNSDHLDLQRTALIDHCSTYAEHVRARLAEDYFFRFDDGEIMFAGPTSAQFFRKRLLSKLAETAFNLEWIERAGGTVEGSERHAAMALARELGRRESVPGVLQRYLEQHDSVDPAERSLAGDGASHRS